MKNEQKDELFSLGATPLEDIEKEQDCSEYKDDDVTAGPDEKAIAGGHQVEKCDDGLVELVLDPLVEKTRLAGEYLQGILSHMGLEARIIVEIKNRSIYIDIEGEEPGLVIGHRGQNLDALQHLVNRFVNPGSDDVIPVTIDSDDYRKRRSNQVEHLVHQITREVLSSGEEVVTDPMTPSERRLFHIAAGHIRGIRTESLGNGFFQPIRVFPVKDIHNGNVRYPDRDSIYDDSMGTYNREIGQRRRNIGGEIYGINE